MLAITFNGRRLYAAVDEAAYAIGLTVLFETPSPVHRAEESVGVISIIFPGEVEEGELTGAVVQRNGAAIGTIGDIKIIDSEIGDVQVENTPASYYAFLTTALFAARGLVTQ